VSAFFDHCQVDDSIGGHDEPDEVDDYDSDNSMMKKRHECDSVSEDASQRSIG
jgi:hypothetical protein